MADSAVRLLKPIEFEDGMVLQDFPGPDQLEVFGEKATEILSAAKVAHQQFLRTINPTEEEAADAASHALRLAKLDPIYRAGPRTRIVEQAVTAVDPLDVQDLVGLWRIIPFEGPMAACLRDDVWLNPTFGRFSVGIQGADADVIAASTLIDIKTSIHPAVKPHLAQLIGYAMLAEAYKSEEAPEFPQIEKVGLYFARQGALVEMQLEAARQGPDFAGAFDALMAHCENEPLTLSDVRSGARSADSKAPSKNKPIDKLKRPPPRPD